ncbi:hypothetical protein PP1Y_AT3425 [Novosphingobium sp. PP1Y]|nr:hypothetical protein PP1Y_AT3425 [Novosphingobium sp. PP1Y]
MGCLWAGMRPPRFQENTVEEGSPIARAIDLIPPKVSKMLFDETMSILCDILGQKAISK